MPRDSQRDAHRRDYDRARDAFDDLDSDDQARFLAATTVAAVARGVKTVSRALADELDAFFGEGASGASERPSGEQRERGGGGPGPAEPPTGAQRREA